MKISLIEAKPASFNGFEKFVIPRLGLPIMAAMLESEGHDARVYVHQLESVWQHWLEISRSDLIGISTITPSAPEAYDLARWIRWANRVRKRQIPVVLGGPHVSFLPEEGLEHADFVVRGEGEHTLLELVRALEGGGDLSGIKGLSYREDGKIRHNPDRPLECDLDSIPFADLTLMAGHEKLKHLPIATSRGCPHDCNFCSVVSMFGRAYRRRSNHKVIAEIEEHLLPLGRRIFFVDDNFAGRPAAAKGLLAMMKKRGLGRKMRWYTQVTVHAARDEQLLDLMKDTHCTQIYVGLESINPETLKELHKKQSVAQIRHCVKMFHKRGIRVHGMFMLGSDHDDTDSIDATVEFAKKEGIDTVQFAILTPLPGTRTFASLEAENRLFTRDWSLYDAFHAVHEPARMSMYELQKAAMDAWKQFYSVPSYVNAFMRFELATGFLRFYGRRIAKRGRVELEDYLRKLMPLQMQPQS
ncbi:MAG: radical SAM protein [Deltaproteobacteria bacterium]|nr:radical SAM protein [Deltaproteobacteria bacterium]